LHAGIQADVTVYRRADDPSPMATITCTYAATYLIDDQSILVEAKEDDLIEFVIQFGSQHTWPYIREFVHTTAQRMLLPHFVLPYAGSVMIVHRQKNQSENTEDTK